MEDREPTPARGEERHLALSLVNTRVIRPSGVVDRLSTVRELDRWLRLRGLAAPATSAGDLVAVIGLRKVARSILTAIASNNPLPPSARGQLNQALTEAVRPILSIDRRLGWEPIGTPSVAAVLAREVLKLVTSDSALQVRTCAAPDCDRMFVRTHGRQAWCSPQCGGRERARRHARARAVR